MELKFQNKFRKFGFYICLSIFTILLYFAIYDYAVNMYYWSIFYSILLVINCFIFYSFTKLKMKDAITVFFIFYTILVYINVVYFYEIFPTSCFYFVPLIIAFKYNYSPIYFYLYISILIILSLFIPFFSSFIKQLINFDWYYLPSKDEVLINNITDFMDSFLISIATYLFSNELKKEKLEQKYLRSFINKVAHENNLKRIIFIANLNENQEYENEKEKLFFTIRNIVEKEVVYINYNYDISMISKRLKVSTKEINNALNYHEDRIIFDDFLNFYRFKAVKKMIIDKLHLGLNLKEIYTAAGFKYKSKFNDVFNFFEGITPEIFINNKNSMS